MNRVQENVAETIIGTNVTIKIGNKEYKCKRPTIMTLIEVSRLINKYPSIERERGNEVNQMLRIAKDAEPLGMIVATLITGYEKGTIRGFLDDIRRKQLARYILNNNSCKEVSEALIVLLAKLEIVDFFGITTSLSKINLTKKTKEVV